MKNENLKMSVNLEHWYPVASSSDLPKRHVYQAQLWGREMAVWRADDGFVNVWENRCLHRGVRLASCAAFIMVGAIRTAPLAVLIFPRTLQMRPPALSATIHIKR
jgi:hypothetical protein